jgi:hypothetical protein
VSRADIVSAKAAIQQVFAGTEPWHILCRSVLMIYLESMAAAKEAQAKLAGLRAALDTQALQPGQEKVDLLLEACEKANKEGVDCAVAAEGRKTELRRHQELLHDLSALLAKHNNEKGGYLTKHTETNKRKEPHSIMLFDNADVADEQLESAGGEGEDHQHMNTNACATEDIVEATRDAVVAEDGGLEPTGPPQHQHAQKKLRMA